MTTLGEKRDGWTTGVAIAATLVFVGAFAVRGIAGRAPLEAVDRPRAPDELAAPMQLLGASAFLRAGELTPRVRETLREEWLDVQKFTARLSGCPRTADWLTTPAGLRFERLADELRRGSREEALACLYLVFELTHRTDWSSGLMERTQDAEKLAGLLREWLRAWAERATDDTLLAEPAVAATITYARAMRTVASPMLFGAGDAATVARAKQFLSDLLYDVHGQPKRMYGLLKARHPSALDDFETKRDALGGLSEACGIVFPELENGCGK